MAMVVCERCGHIQEFFPRTEKMEGGVERVYIKCGKCGEQYTSYYTDKQIRALQARQRRIGILIDGTTRTGRCQQLWDEYNDNKQKLAIMMFELRRKAEHGTPPGSNLPGKK